MAKRNEQRVIVEGQEFDSMTSAAKFIGCDVSCIRWALNFNKSRKYKELSVRFADEAKEAAVVASFDKARVLHNQQRKARRVKALSAKYSPIYCENLNKTFSTLKAAAKFAKTSTYSMSTKTEVAGRFVDKAGNVYTRVKPMRSNKQYPNTGDKIKVDKASGYARTQVEQPIAKPSEPSAEELIKNSLRDTTIKCINEGHYDWAKSITSVMCELFNK